METQDILSYILPKEILNYFELVKVEEEVEDNKMYFYLDEKFVKPKEHSDKHLVSKGFYDYVEIQDFPLRERALVLRVRRRKWLDKETNKVYAKKLELTANGTSYTKEFAAFLKETLG